MKEVGPPNYHLGADMEKIKQPEKVYTVGSGTYNNKCLVICEQIFRDLSPKKVFTTLDPKDHP